MLAVKDKDYVTTPGTIDSFDIGGRVPAVAAEPREIEQISRNTTVRPGVHDTRPGMLIAMVSRDTIVLAKLIRTLCPRHVLLFCTAHVRANRWAESASRFLEDLARDRPEILGGYSLVDPFTTAELAALTAGDEIGLDQLRALGMEDIAPWREYLEGVRRSRDQCILGLDQLDRAMGASKKL